MFCQHFQKTSPQKHLGQFQSNFICSILTIWGSKICSNGLGHLITWPPCPYMVKILKQLLLQKHWADWLETWYVVSVDWVLSSVGDPVLALTHFCHGQIWSLSDIERGKGETLHFSKTMVICDMKVFQWPWPKVTRIECLSTFSNDLSPETTGLILIRFHMQHLGNKGSKVYSNSPGHMT